MNEPELDALTRIFLNLGADDRMADVMAKQLLKRSDQMARERSITQTEALDYLLKVTIAGREGRAYEGEPPGNGTTKRD